MKTATAFVAMSVFSRCLYPLDCPDVPAFLLSFSLRCESTNDSPDAKTQGSSDDANTSAVLSM
jgi:hypothetical protein